MIANTMATFKATDPEAYESVWQDALSGTKDALRKELENDESLDAAMKILDMICNDCVADPFAMVEVMQMMQENKES